jgi:hypothetical protein
MVPHPEDLWAKILMEVVDYGLLIFGGNARKAIYFHLEKDYSLTKEMIPENMEAFANGLERMFGAGATVIERSIQEQLCSKLGVKCEKDYKFIDSLNNVKKVWLNKHQA